MQEGYVSVDLCVCVCVYVCVHVHSQDIYSQWSTGQVYTATAVLSDCGVCVCVCVCV